jgi:hypothetical protein
VNILGRSIPEVARLGFDHGWLCLPPPRFLNLGRPVLLVDFRLIGGDPPSLGLEPFGSRDPDTELPLTLIETDLHPGRLIALWSADGRGQRQLLAYNRAATALSAWTEVARCGELAVLIVGDTHAVQLGWAALWDCHIGLTHTASMAARRSPRSGEPALPAWPAARAVRRPSARFPCFRPSSGRWPGAAVSDRGPAAGPLWQSGTVIGIGERIAAYRRRRGLSQVALAGLVGRSES